MDDATLYELFSAHGTVQKAEVVVDRDTRQSRGFGFVEMANEDQVQSTIQAMDGYETHGRALKVNEARPKGQRLSNFRGDIDNSPFIRRFADRRVPTGYVEPERRGKKSRRG